jgi:hypothetical protein
MIEKLRIYLKGFFENVTIEELAPWSMTPDPPSLLVEEPVTG